jgi:hypothetical protein
MGLFDYVTCEYDLPDGFDATGVQFQTKDTDAQYMETYRIDGNGRLWHQAVRYEDRSDPTAEKGSPASVLGCQTPVPTGWELVEHHGTLDFYTSNICASWGPFCATDDDSPPWSANYVALYDHGILLKIEGYKEMLVRRHVTLAAFHNLTREEVEAAQRERA